MADLTTSLLAIRDLRVDLTVDREVLHALRGVNLSVGRGDQLALVGESGSGKTMTVLSVMRLLPSTGRIVSGQILFDGMDLAPLPESAIRPLRGRRIAMIFQNAHAALNPLIRVGDQIADVYRRHGKLSRKAAWDKAAEALEATGIPNAPERARNFPHEYSGGMAQRAMIALALASSPELLIADEPTSGLDVTIQGQVIDLIREVAHRLNTTLIIISHDIGLVSTICDQLAVMYAGVVMESGTTAQIMQHPANPYTAALLRYVEAQPGERMPFIPGRVVDLRQMWQGCPFAPRCEFVQQICHEQAPPLIEVEPGHVSVCHFARQVFERSLKNDPAVIGH
jgi:oligopeptide/dipeptide ABC transporter ATP-binding protein